MSDLSKAIEELAERWEVDGVVPISDLRSVVNANPEPEHEESMVAKALMDAANDPELRLSGHSGISITKLRARAIREQMIDDE